MYKALVSFGGCVSMSAGDVKDIPDVNIAKELLKAGYIEEISPAKEKAQAPAKTEEKTETKKPSRRTKKG